MGVKKEDIAIYLSQIRTSVSFSAFMTAAVVFFFGMLITKFNEYNILIKIPLAFLIISTFGFLYSALVYANSSEEIIQKKAEKFKKHMQLGDILSEYLGVYLLILSIPLAINVVTSDIFLRIVTVIASLTGLTLYQFSHFSISERHFPRGHKIISIIVIAFGILLFLTQIYSIYFVPLSAICILFILLIAFLATK